MRSIDANVALRVLLRDDPAQEIVARRVLSGPVLLLPTVVLEIVWILQGKGWSREQIADGFDALLKLETLFVREEEALRWVVDRYRDLGDFPDMYHVALSREADSFVTFDQRVERYATGGPVAVETLR